MERGTIKLPEPAYEHHNEQRKELGLTWEQYLNEQSSDLREREVEAAERQADALETIAGAMLMSESDDRQLNPEALLREAKFHADPEGNL